MTTNSQTPTFLEKQTKQNEPKVTFKWLMFLLTMFMVSLLILYFINFHEGWGDKNDFGAFGDYFGGVLNPIFGFATVGLLLWSLKYQMDELALTRQVLKETQKEAALSRQAMEAQVEHFQKEAQLNELRQILAIQMGFIDKCLNTIVNKKKVVHNGEATYFNVSILDILNFDTDIEDEEYKLYQQRISSTSPNQISKNIKELEQHIFQYATLTLEYNEVSNYSFNTYPYLTKAITLISNLTTFSKSKNLDEPMAMLNSAIEQSLGTDND